MNHMAPSNFGSDTMYMQIYMEMEETQSLHHEMCHEPHGSIKFLGQTPCISYIEIEETQSLFHKCVMNRGCTKFTMVLWIHPFL
jgi:hypothetical protein